MAWLNRAIIFPGDRFEIDGTKTRGGDILDINQFTILTVDDSKLIRTNVRRMLDSLGVRNILEASNGREALGILDRQRVDLIVSDWNMPEMSGHQLLQAVRANQTIKHLPFIMLTAEGEKDKVVAALQAGVTNYIVKPFNQETLFNKIKKYLPEAIRKQGQYGKVDWQTQPE